MNIKDFNNTKFTEDDLNSYIKNGRLTSEKEEELNLKVKDSLKKSNKKNIFEYVNNLLEPSETIENIMSGIDINNLGLETSISKFLVSPQFESNLNIFCFITTTRIFIVNTNYLSGKFSLTIYKKANLKSLNYNSTNLSSIDKLVLAVGFIVGISALSLIPTINLFFKISLFISYLIALFFIVSASSKSNNFIKLSFNNGDTFKIMQTPETF